MLAGGLQVERVGVVPTPALYYAVASRALDGGMQITGSLEMFGDQRSVLLHRVSLFERGRQQAV